MSNSGDPVHNAVCYIDSPETSWQLSLESEEKDGYNPLSAALSTIRMQTTPSTLNTFSLAPTTVFILPTDWNGNAGKA